ncbi:hypothetical protein QE382_003787 [Sphingobacterium zeae]|uniref:DUF4304 domain-containing protein n=1 Tax=Sphingobacterium zeae TaxID=1776859 RepID=A0ABU0UAD9_9SPHI|nr:DUF4304 domain-containing protein [Sphingobacterium zeae]MDQ1151803.1 hypothetical protein [Sphingobacterium zeae]
MAVFKELSKVLTPILKTMGFSKKGNSFYLKVGKNYGVINLQKSRESEKDIIKFTINFGVYSDVLGQLQYGYNSSAKPGIEQCHWGARVGEFMPRSPDYWWYFNASDNLSSLTSNVMEAV